MKGCQQWMPHMEIIKFATRNHYFSSEKFKNYILLLTFWSPHARGGFLDEFLWIDCQGSGMADYGQMNLYFPVSASDIYRLAPERSKTQTRHPKSQPALNASTHLTIDSLHIKEIPRTSPAKAPRTGSQAPHKEMFFQKIMTSSSGRRGRPSS